jgi:hypothetical protein
VLLTRGTASRSMDACPRFANNRLRRYAG